MTCPPRFDDGMVNMAELIRAMAELLVNEIMDARADEARGSGSRRNGHRERKLVASVGAANLRIPKLLAGSYFPEDLIERYLRVDRAVVAAVSEMVTNGVSTRKVKRAARTMGMDRMSASQVSRICSSLDESVADLQERDPSDVTCPYIWLDATYIKCRDASRVQSTTLVTANGVGSGGYRRLLGLDAIDTESYTNFRDTTSWPVPCARVGIYPERSRGGACENVAVMVAIGVNDDRYREALAGAT